MNAKLRSPEKSISSAWSVAGESCAPAADALIATTQPTSYDLAVKILVDLRDLDARRNGDSFHSPMKTLRQASCSKAELHRWAREGGVLMADGMFDPVTALGLIPLKAVRHRATQRLQKCHKRKVADWGS